VTPQDMAGVLTRYVAAVNDHDVEAMLALRHPDASLEVMGGGPRVQGLDTLRDFYRAVFAQVPDYRLDMDGMAFGDDVATVWGRLRATAGTTWFGRPATGGAVDAPVCFVCDFADGRFRADRMYVDTATLDRQAGVVATV
jgi:steroid delta-isomerase-like uncharacterized protein